MPKQPRNRDGVYTRPDRPGYWGSWTDATGRRVRQNLNAPTLTQARTELEARKTQAREHRKAIANGEAPPTEETFTQVAKRYLGYQEKRRKAGAISEQELVRQQGIMEKHLLPFFGPLKIANIRRSKLNAYIESRTGQAAAGTIIKEANVLKHLFALACDEWEIISLNPAKRLKLPEAPEGRTRHLDPQELRTLLEACPPWLRPIVGLAVSTGMRRGEFLRISWKDVDVKASRILLAITKNGKPRYAYLNQLSHQVIASLQPEEHKPADKLFPDVTPAGVTVAFIRACRTAGIEDFSIHDLRHTYASQLRMRGADLHTVGQLLGHKDLRMTARYAHLNPGFLGDAAGKLDEVFTEPLLLEPKKS
jgi:integrase